MFTDFNVGGGHGVALLVFWGAQGGKVQQEARFDLLHAYKEKREDRRETGHKEEHINQSEGQR